jgi:hypothetical protein
MATTMGKVLVLINVAFSLMMATIALGLYNSNLDYDHSQKDVAGKPPAGVTALKTEIESLQKTSVPAVQASWSAALSTLLKREEERRAYRKHYDDQLLLLRGDATKPAMPVKMVEIGADHLPVLDAGGFPKLVDAFDRAGQPVMQMTFYTAQLDIVRKEQVAVLDNLNKQIDRYAELTKRLAGAEGKRGLRQMLVDERDKRLDVVAEYNSVRPLFINTAVESQLVEQRLATMKEQIEQLKAYLRMKHKVDVAMKGR